MGNGPSRASYQQQKERAEQLKAELAQLKEKPKILPTPFRHCPFDGAVLEAKRRVLLCEKSDAPQTIPYLRLLMLGLVGSGKTSFANTIYSALKKKVIPYTPVGKDHRDRSVTKRFRVHVFEGQLGHHESESAGSKKGHFHLCDTMGVEGDDGVTEDDVTAILDGHIKNKYEFNPSKVIDRSSPLYNPNPTMTQRMHCVAFCVDATKMSMLEGEGLGKMRRIKKRIIDRDISLIILLTNIDLACRLVMGDPSKTFFSPIVKEAVEKAAEIFGVPVNQVYPVKNYENETQNVAAIDILALSACIRMVEYANAFVQLDTTDVGDDY